MNYQKIYKDLVLTAKSQKRVKLSICNPNYIYYENHHIIPRCLGGIDNPDNLVLLTAKEHFIVHKLLVKIHPESKGLRLAIHRMIHGIQNNHLILTARDYKLSKELLSGEFSPMFGKKQSNETKKKIGKANSISLLGNKLSKETKEKIGLGNKGKKRSKKAKENYSKCKKGILKSEDHKKKLSEANKGQIPWNKGIQMSKEFCEKTRKGIKEKRLKSKKA
jgi:hypothetical protein